MTSLYGEYFVRPQQALGINTPGKRFAFWTIAAGAALWALQPEALFEQSGRTRQWAGTYYLTGQALPPGSVYLNYPIASIALGGLISVL